MANRSIDSNSSTFTYHDFEGNRHQFDAEVSSTEYGTHTLSAPAPAPLSSSSFTIHLESLAQEHATALKRISYLEALNESLSQTIQDLRLLCKCG